ncbi:unnamed protein product [Rotaria sordida]|uniref:Uncharacterized protein n=1 Tax=Rotaria sordida TaxID=392033 RepID=A0A815KEX7_9BILA|nr:unnamed protein product [Rotaria sordida]
MQQLAIVALLSPMGFVAVHYMAQLALVSRGVPREYLALVNIPVTLIAIMAPLTIRHTELPLTWFAGCYALNLISGIPIAAFVYFTPQIISMSYYYPLLILLLASSTDNLAFNKQYDSRSTNFVEEITYYLKTFQFQLILP